MLDVAQAIGLRLAKAAIGGRVAGTHDGAEEHLVGTSYALVADDRIAIVTLDDVDSDVLDTVRHSVVHLTTQAAAFLGWMAAALR